jgi:TolA-binding protein
VNVESMEFLLSMRKRLIQSIPVICLLLCVACVSSPTTVREVSSDVSQISQQVDEGRNRRQRIRATRQDIMAQMKELLDSETPRITERQQLLAPPTIQRQPETDINSFMVQPGQTEPARQSTPSVAQERADTLDLFQRANAGFNKGEYTTAVESYTLVYEYAVTPDLKARTLYRIGDCYYNNRDWEKAITILTKLEFEHKDHAIIPSAMLKKGYSQVFSGSITRGKDTLQKLIQQFPEAKEAALAKARLEELG